MPYGANFETEPGDLEKVVSLFVVLYNDVGVIYVFPDL